MRKGPGLRSILAPIPKDWGKNEQITSRLKRGKDEDYGNSEI